MTVFNRATIRDVLAFAGHSAPPDKPMIRCPLPDHNDSTPSFKIVGERGWSCFGCNRKGGIADLVLALEFARSPAEAANWLEQKLGETPWQPVAVYAYCDDGGGIRYEAVRQERAGEKKFVMRVPNAGGGYAYKLNGVARIPYRLPELLAAKSDGRTIIVVEGEKDADRLTSLGLAATTNAGGAGWTWTAAFAEPLRGAARIAIVTDSDAPGRKAAVQRAQLLSSLCGDVRLIDLAPERVDGFDISDWLDAGGSVEALRELVSSAPCFDAFAVAPASSPATEIRLDAGSESVNRALTVRRLSEFPSEDVRWLWKNRLAIGKLSLVVGDPGGGKSWLTLAIASAISRGRALPDDEASELGDVLFIVYEDGVSDTVRPRAERCGCDLDRLHVVEGPRVQPVDGSDSYIEPFRPTHVRELDAYLSRSPAVRALVIDPIANFVGANVRQGADNEVRAALEPLKALADRRGIAIAAVMHLRKAEAEKLLYRVSGSVAYAGVARSVLLVAREEETGRRSVCSLKNSLGPEPDPIEFAIDDDGFAWRGVATDLGAEQLLAPGRPQRARSDVDLWLRAQLENGPVGVTELFEAGHRAGHSRDRIKRAKTDLGAVARKSDFRGSWQWALPSLPSLPSENGSPKGADDETKSASALAQESKNSLPSSTVGSEESEERISSPREHLDGAAPCEFHRGKAGDDCQRCGVTWDDHRRRA